MRGITPENARHLCALFQQEAVITREGLTFADGAVCKRIGVLYGEDAERCAGYLETFDGVRASLQFGPPLAVAA